MAQAGSKADTRFVLVGLAGPAAGAEFPIEETTLVGRSKDVDVHIADDQVSRRHVMFSIVRDGRSYVKAEDLQSRNGLHVNGHRIKATLLDDGDHVLIGRTVFRLERRRPGDISADSVFGEILEQLHGWPGPGVSAQGAAVR
jgi:pSer/pThr/pTyr-binding forkhead associated (FHA) protein